MNESFIKNDRDIAIIGMNARLPGSRNIKEFWEHLLNGDELISFFSREELEESDIPYEQYTKSNYVAARGIVSNIELFDPTYFKMNSKEAALICPQQRVFLECCEELLIKTGLNKIKKNTQIGVFATSSSSDYFHQNLLKNLEVIQNYSYFDLQLGIEKDFLSTRTSYKLSLTGPSINLQTGCSSSLVAIHAGMLSLNSNECEIALVGGSSLSLPQKSGYLYQKGMIASSDGHCRSFSHAADGTIKSNGVAVIALKKLSKAEKDGDKIYAVLKGSAVNNDGSSKIGFTAPSVDGQSKVMAAALLDAGITADAVSFIETHGTGTQIGDPIEFRALNRVYGNSDAGKNDCVLGALKTNIGHLDVISGVVGLIKTALCLYFKKIPATLHFDKPNHLMDFAHSRFSINSKTIPWDLSPNIYVRYAAVSSFGMGGTNAHVILSEYQQDEPASLSNFDMNSIFPNKERCWVEPDKIPVKSNTVEQSKRAEEQTEIDYLKIVEIFESYLGKKIDPENDNFFECGGSSLLILNIYEKIEKITNIQIQISKIYEDPSIFSFAQSCVSNKQSAFLSKNNFQDISFEGF